MSAPIQTPRRILAEYKAAEARLAEVREVAVKGFEAAQERRDVEAADQFKEAFQKELRVFRSFRGTLSPDARASFNIDRILDSFSIDQDAFVNVVIPADVGDEEAMRALNERHMELFPRRSGAAIGSPEIGQILDAGGGCGRRRYGPRIIRLLGVVPNTVNMTRDQQAEALRERGLTFPHPIEQALAAAVFACMRDGADLFERLYVRSSIPAFSLFTNKFNGVIVSKSHGFDNHELYAASGTPVSAKIK